MARIQTFAKDLQLATAGIAPAAINAELAKFAISELNKSISAGEGSPRYKRYVNGRLGAPETSVQAPGPILYDFIWWDEIVQFALKFLEQRSPFRSGRYRGSWIVRADGIKVTDFSKIDLGDTVEIVNTQPYARKIDVGFMKMSVPPFIVEDARKAVMARYGNMITARRTMILLPGGYILKGVFSRGIREKARTKLASDTVAGAPMKYPTLTMRIRE